MRSPGCLRPLLIVTLVLAGGFALQPAHSDVILPPLPIPEAADPSPFLLRQTDVRTVVSGPVAHVAVTQRWENPNANAVDGLYIFPLPENAAVTDMSLTIGDRHIRGEMRRREEARALYERARSEGRVAGLLDQERPNIFAQRVANIMPGTAVEVLLKFDQTIECAGGVCDYVFPTVVGPRFVPAHQTDPGSINPPVVTPGRSTGQRLSLSVALETGVSLYDLESPSHRVTISHDGPARASVRLAEGDSAALNRDFRLRWRVGAEAPEVGLLSWRDPLQEERPGVFSLIIQPPSGDIASFSEEDAIPRELVFVLDCSGSMRGAPLAAARNVVKQALRTLRGRDTFQIIRFSERSSGLGPRPLPNNPENIRKALTYLDGLHGQGGTRMIEGIRAALHRPPDPERLRIVAFLTDGYIGNETEILREVRRTLGGARLFSFGIGSSVNRFLLEGLAEEGRGEAAFLGPRESPDEMVDRFVRRIATPVLTDIQVTWEDVEVEDLEPPVIPDLFAGHPLVIHGRYRKPGTGIVRVEGRRGGLAVTFRRVILLRDRAADNEALGRLWARARIHRLSRELHEGNNPEVEKSIITLGLRHRLMTRWTSLVAVDNIVSNTTGVSTAVDVPVELPEDVSYEGVFGRKRVLARQGSMAAPILSQPVGRVGRFAGGQVGGASGDVRALKKHAEADAPAPEVGRSDDREQTSGFKRLTLVEASGVRLVVEDDGEVWRLEGRSRRLVTTLSSSRLREIRRAIRVANPQSWSGGNSPGARLILETEGGRRIVLITSTDAAVGRLVQLVRKAAS